LSVVFEVYVIAEEKFCVN